MKKCKKWVLNGAFLLLLAVVLAMSGMSSMAMAADPTGDILVVPSGGVVPAGSTDSLVNINRTLVDVGPPAYHTTTITPYGSDNLNISSGSSAGYLHMNSISDVSINVNTDGIKPLEAFTVNVGGGGVGTAVPVTITTISSNQTSTTITTPGGGTLTTNATALTAMSGGNGLTVNNSGAISLMNNTSGAAASGLTIDATGNTVTLLNNVADGPGTVPATGHGLIIGPTNTTLTGGSNSSDLILEDSAATLAVGTATTPEIQVIQATNTAGVTAVNIGGTTNVLNNITAMYANGVNNLTANATTGTNNIEAHTNNIGVATPGSVNTVGNAGTSTNVMTGDTNTITGTTSSTMTGGSTSLVLNNFGATFSNSTGGPVQVHGVDDGTSPYDAVNVQQLGAGLAMVAGLAALPQVEQGKTFAIGVGTGGYQSQVSLAGGVSARFLDNFVFKAGGAFIPGYSGKTAPVWNAALQYSF